MRGKYTKANKINARAAQYQYKELCTILILPPCLTYTRRNIWWNVVAWRTITPKTSLCVDAGATSAEKGIALTLINVCGEKGRHITAGSSTATTAAQIMSQHCNSCERTSLPNPFSGNDPAALLGVQSTYWDKAQDCSMYRTHTTPACNLPLPCTNICAGAGDYYRPRNIPLSWLNPSLPIVCCLSQLHQPRLTLEPLLQLAIS